jgi:hypothetical protein
MTATFAKLLFVEAVKVKDADGRDEIVFSRADGVIFDRANLRAGDFFEFDDDRLLPFKSDQSPVSVRFTEVNESFPDPITIGFVSITASEVGLGDRKQQVDNAGAVYELTYRVI